MIALIAQGLAFTPADTAAEKVAKIARGLRDLASGEHVALVADLLELPVPTPLALHPDVQRRKTMEMLARWNLALSTIQPLVLLVEDSHWCDASSLELAQVYATFTEGFTTQDSSTRKRCWRSWARRGILRRT